jgi:hypothetical protein
MDHEHGHGDMPEPGKKLGDEDKRRLLDRLQERFREGTQYYARDFKRMRLLDAADCGDLWKAVNAQFPSYQILPDSNWVSYVKSNLLASLYTVAKAASILPTQEGDRQAVEQINVLLENLWDTVDVPYFEYQAGDRAALQNLGITQVGWSENMQLPGELVDKNVSLKNVDPLNFMFDPFASDFDKAGWCCTFERFHRSYFLGNSNYREEFKKIPRHDTSVTMDYSSSEMPEKAPVQNSKDTYMLVTFWVRETNGDKPIISEYHTIDCRHLLYYKRDIKPSMYPFALLYCNLPGKRAVGVSEPAKIFANSLAYNLMDSLLFTSEYKNQRPPKFISAGSGLNIQSFSQHGADADRTFIVNGPVKDAVTYHQFPPISPTLPAALQRLEYNMQNVTGVDQKYTGRDTGSIITTGGTEEMLNRVTLIDSPKIVNYEKYAKRLTQLILLNLCEFSPKRTYLLRKPNMTGNPSYQTVDIDIGEMFDSKSDWMTLFKYTISISSELPKNRQRISAMANMLMEKQMQYRQNGTNIDLITEEEWLQMQDLPNREYMLERMGVQRMTSELEETTATIEQYAQMVMAGVDPEEALARTAASSAERRYGIENALPGTEGDVQVAPMGADQQAMGQPLPTMPQA